MKEETKAEKKGKMESEKLCFSNWNDDGFKKDQELCVLSREEFIKLTISTLQSKLDEEHSRAPSCQNLLSVDSIAARQAFEELSYDFPVVETQQINSLAFLVLECIEPNSLSRSLPQWFWYSPKVIEGIRYCLFERDHGDNDQSFLKSLAWLDTIMSVKLADFLLGDQISRDELLRLLLGSSCSSNISQVASAVLQIPRLFSIPVLDFLSSEQWIKLELTGCLERLFRRVDKLTGDLDCFKSHFFNSSVLGSSNEEELCAAADEYKPALSFVFFALAAYSTRGEEQLAQVIPKLAELASCQTSTDKARIDNLVDALAVIVTPSSFLSSEGDGRKRLWFFIKNHVVSKAADCFDSLANRHRAGARASQQGIDNLLRVLDFYGNGYVQEKNSDAVKDLLDRGILKAISTAWLDWDDKDKVDASALTKCNPCDTTSSTISAFMFDCAVRSDDFLKTLIESQGFYALALDSANVSIGERFAWAALVSSKFSSGICNVPESICEEKPFLVKNHQTRSPEDYLKLAQKLIADIWTMPSDMGRIKVFECLAERIKNPLFVKRLRDSELSESLVALLESALKQLHQYRANQPEKGSRDEVPNHSKVSESMLADRSARLHLVLKRLLCSFEGRECKTD